MSKDFLVAAATVSSALIIANSIFISNLLYLIQDDIRRNLSNKKLKTGIRVFGVYLLIFTILNTLVLIAALIRLGNPESGFLNKSIILNSLIAAIGMFSLIVAISGWAKMSEFAQGIRKEHPTSQPDDKSIPQAITPDDKDLKTS